MIYTVLIVLLALVVAAWQDYRTGEVFDLIWLVSGLGVTGVFLFNSQYFSLVAGVIQLLMCVPVFYFIERMGWWGRADSFALSLIILATSWGFYWKLPLVGLTTFAYGYLLDRNNKELRVIPGITIGYILLLIIKFVNF